MTKTFDTVRRDPGLREGRLVRPLDCTRLTDWRRRVVYPVGTEVYFRRSTAEPQTDQLRVYVPVTVTELEWLDPVPADFVEPFHA